MRTVKDPIISPADLADLAGRRPVFLWGASQAGMGMWHALKRMGVEVAGFLDKRKAIQGTLLCGLNVHSPEEPLNGSIRSESPFVINTTFQHKDEISRLCESAGLRHIEDFVSYDELNPLDYQVVVAGICNLRCISCPVGNVPEKAPSGLMPADVYRQVLEKVLRENPYIGIIQMYNWGEPLLNPELPQMIRMTRERNVLSAISSNLSLAQDFEEVIRARPGCFRISLSGWGDTYAITHARGKWELVVKNMKRLSEMRSRHCPEMPVEVTYHLYSHNLGDVEKVRELCKQLGFVFRPHMAALLPLDNVAAYRRGDPLSSEAQQTIGMLLIPMDEALQRAAAERRLSCNFDHALNIDWDGTVKHCGLYYSRNDNTAAESYLETPLEEILARRRSSRLCRDCREHGLHRFCRVYTDATLPQVD